MGIATEIAMGIATEIAMGVVTEIAMEVAMEIAMEIAIEIGVLQPLQESLRPSLLWDTSPRCSSNDSPTSRLRQHSLVVSGSVLTMVTTSRLVVTVEKSTV